MAEFPSSHGSLDGEGFGGGGADTRRGDRAPSEAGDDGFDSEEFREYLRDRAQRRAAPGGDRGGRGRAVRAVRDTADSDDDRGMSKGVSGQPPEWNGVEPSFQDWLIKARLWIATTRAKPRTQGPLILQRLTGQPFQAFKHWARDGDWLQDERGGYRLLEAMNSPEYFGDDQEEDLLASLSRITYHLKRGRDEQSRTFIARWEEALRKVKDHSVVLPEKYLGFLLINALGLNDLEIKSLMTFSQGSILPKDIKTWLRKHEMKLQSKDIGLDRDKKNVMKSAAVHHVNYDNEAEEDIMLMEQALHDLQGGEEHDEEHEIADEDGEEELLEEHEAAEVLNTMLHSRKKTFMQSMKVKKAKELARGYGNWRKKDFDNRANGSSSSRTVMSTTGRLQGGNYRMSIEELKKVSKCKACNQVGHWHKDPQCPKNNNKTKEAHYMENLQDETEEAIFCGNLMVDGQETDENYHLVKDDMRTEAADRGFDVCQDLSGADRGSDFERITDQQESVSHDGCRKAEIGEVYNDRSSKDGDSVSSGLGELSDFSSAQCVRGHEILWMGSRGERSRPAEETTFNEELCGTLDTGCQRMAVGINTLKLFQDALSGQTEIGVVPQEFQFRSVHGRSKTTHVATVPTSLGRNGSVLKPAIFTGENSENAPFLISLPFLMSCRTVLHLDPSTGLRAYFKKFGFSVKCHIGPTGALRIPLAEFTKGQLEHLENMNQQLKTRCSEFEILKTAAFCETDLKNRTGDDRTEHLSTGDRDADGSRECNQEKPYRGVNLQSTSTSLGSLGDQAGDGYATCHGVDNPAFDTEGRSGASANPKTNSVLSVANYRDPRGEGDGLGESERQSGHGQQLFDGELIRAGGEDPLGDQLHKFDDQLRGGLHDERGAQVPRACPTMLPPAGVQPLRDPEGRAKSGKDLLAMSPAKGETVQGFHLDRVPTNVAGTQKGSSSTQPTEQECLRGQDGQRVPTSYTKHHWDELPACPDMQIRDQRLRDQGEVLGLWDDPRGPEEDHRGDSRQDQGSAITVEEGNSGQHEQQPEVREPGGKRLQSVRGGTTGVSGVPELPPVEARKSGSGEEVALQVKEIRETLELQPTTQDDRQWARIQRQSEAALNRAEMVWVELMSLISTDPDRIDQVGVSRMRASLGIDGGDHKACGNHKTFSRYADVLGLSQKQARVVAEVYNPSRFADEAKKQGLIPGQAFDLELGHDLLDKRTRKEVKNYIITVKPGLLIVSPPCVLFTILQNLSMKKRSNNPFAMREYLKQLCKAKALLRFGVEMCEEVLRYDGVFVFEHPLTSKAWQQPAVQRLLQNSKVVMAQCDQCMYGLSSTSGRPQRKSTGWCTSSTAVAEQLSRKCDKSHEHEHIIGKDQGETENKSRQAQKYPAGIVQAIIRGYKQHRKDDLLYVQVTKIDQLCRDIAQSDRLRGELRQVGDEVCHEVHAVGDEGDDVNLFSDEEEVAAEHEVPADAEVIDEQEVNDEPEANVDEAADQPEDDGGGLVRRLPRERGFTIKQLVKRAHDGLGHPSNERLARILRNAKASEEAIREAKQLKCDTCAQHRHIYAPRNAAPPRELHMNQIVGIDTVWLPTHTNKNRMALNIVCWASRFQMIVPLTSHTPPAARKAYLRWIRLFGPPEKAYVDLGKEFRGAFEYGAEIDTTYIEPGALETPTQRSITERAGKTYKTVLSKALEHYVCQSTEEWEELVDITSMVCNRLINKSGYSPIQRVLGYCPRVPGGLMTGGFNDLPTASRLHGGDQQLQVAQAMRLAAARAFHEADASQALRNALHAGARPVRNFEAGQLVYFWRKGAEHAKKDRPYYWHGPARVILTALPTTVWLTYRGYVVKASPEHVRHANQEEQFSLSEWIDDIADTRRQVNEIPRKGYIDLSNEEFPKENQEEQVQPKYRLQDKTKRSRVQPREAPEDEWQFSPELGVLRRIHNQPRKKLFVPMEAERDRPVPLAEIRMERRTVVQLSHGPITEHRDLWLDGERPRDDELQVEPWTGYTEFNLNHRLEVGPQTKDSEKRDEEKEQRSEDSKRRRIDHEEPTGPSAESVPRIEMDQGENVENLGEPSPGGEPEDENGEKDEEQDTTGLREDRVRQAEEIEDDRPTKKLRTEFLEVYWNAVEKALVAKQKKEIVFRQLSEQLRPFYLTAIKKEIHNNIESGAYEILDPETSELIRREKDDKIVKSRYVLTEKGIDSEDIDKARADGVLLHEDGESSTKAKARHVMKGFSEENSEYLEVTTPQVGKDSVFLSLQLMVSNGWIPGYLDFTQAFHSGDALKREIYAEQPAEGIPGYGKRQLLKLKKCCYGLLDGPFQWFSHLKRILTENLGYEESTADPCLFFLFGAGRQLQGVISVATDDLLHGGDDRHWRQMQWLNKNYKLGKFSSGDGRFTGKQIEVQPGGGVLVHQELYTSEKVHLLEVDKKRKQRKFSLCNEEEVTRLRGLLGALAWLSKETRPDLAGRVALLQQSMPHPYVQDILEANSLAKEAMANPRLGIKIQPIPMDRLRVGTITDASWGNVRGEEEKGENTEDATDYWVEYKDNWTRMHVQPRRLAFHPGAAEHGPELHDLRDERRTIIDDEEISDRWNHREAQLPVKEEQWTGKTIFPKRKDDEAGPGTINERFLQNQRLASQGGFITFFYDAKMETEDQLWPISIVNWKSYKIKRCTVNTLSAECQAMIQGVGSLHWLRALLHEASGQALAMDRWEEQIAATPFVAITDSRSLYDTITKLRNTASHIEDKRTAIDVTILKNDFSRTKGQVRWVEGGRMISDSLTKKMSSAYLRNVLQKGLWSLTERGFEMQESSILLVSIQ